MKIENIKINSYGKLKNKEIDLSDGINVIYGKNEAGKSTLLKFIQNIFYGTSKNKKGKSFSDYDLYKPWDDEDFSGKIKYSLDSNEKFEVYREFGKKNPKVYNEQLEDITNKFNINKSTGSEFFYEQTNVDEFMFLSSIVSMQREVKLNSVDQNVYIQKIANLASTGDDGVSFKKAIDKLNKKQLDEIGTDRSQGKPINILKNRILEYEKSLESLEIYNNNRFMQEKEEEEVLNKIEKLKNKGNFLKELQNIKQTEKLEQEKLNFKEQLKEKNNNQIKELEEEINTIKNNKNIKIESEEDIKKINIKLYSIISLICIVLGIVSFIITNNIFSIIIMVSLIFLIFAIYLLNKSKINKKIETEENKKKKIDNNIKEKINLLQNKIEFINKNNEEIDAELNTLNNKLDMELDLKKENLKTQYLNIIELSEINSFLEKNDLKEEININEETIHKYEINLAKLNIEKKQTLEKLEEFVDIKEKLDCAQEEYSELQIKNEKINKTKEFIKNAYEKMKNSVTPVFTSNLSNIIEQISDGKYSKVYINDTDGMIVGLPNGEYVSAEKLSTGTIEQLYLSLRLSMARKISKEIMPIILDETFAYYDDERLKNTLKFLKENFKENQILIFTCTHREERCLDNINQKYNLISL